MPTSSAYHFFARLMQRRGYFAQDNRLEDFAFPADMIAAQSRSGFPDFVLKTNPDGPLPGGEFIELKDAKAYQIASFNSTIPSASKPVSSLARNIRSRLLQAGEDLDAVPQRDVHYLIRGIKRTPASPLAKTLLVSGSFFETIPANQVLANAFEQVAAASAPADADMSDLARRLDIRQSHFAASRRVDGASISVRFRVMAQVDPRANLLSDARYPMIQPNTLTMLTHAPDLPTASSGRQAYAWHQVPTSIQQCPAYAHLNQAFDEIAPALKAVTSVSILQRPLNGAFFMAQAPIHP